MTARRHFSQRDKKTRREKRKRSFHEKAGLESTPGCFRQKNAAANAECS